jgi:hypothetical protein
MRPVTSDTVMHLLAEAHGAELLRLIGVDATGRLLRATKLPAEIIDPDCLWDLGDRLVHLEMEANMGPDMAWRLFEYRARFRRRVDLRARPLHQHVLVLGRGSPPGQTRTEAANTDITVDDHGDATFTYHVHLLRNIDPELLLDNPVTAVFAPLGRAPGRHRIALLRRAVEVISATEGPAFERRRLVECLAVLAALRIDNPTIIQTTIKETAMPIDLTESSIVRHYMDQAATEAATEAAAIGRLRGMLELKFGQAGADADDQILAHLATQPDPAHLITEADNLDDLRP